MKCNTQSPLKVLSLIFILILQISCSKDYDLLTNYVLSDVREMVNGKNVVDDTFIFSQNEIAVLDVLSNDVFENPDKVKIVETSTPTNGEIVIIENRTIRYIPNGVTTEAESGASVENVTQEESSSTEEEVVEEAENMTDAFTYTVEIENEDQTVTTEEGTVTVIITPEANKSTDCVTNGGLAGDTGLKTWCWEDISIPEYSGSKGVALSQGHLYIDSECYEKQVSRDRNRLKFRVDPTTPSVDSWCSRDYNMRAEIRTAPWPVQHELGTEEWFGWSFTFGDDYVIDTASEWLFHQVHNGIVGQTPLYELMVAREGIYDAAAGEIVVKNNANSPDRVLTGIIPVAGQTIDVVVHVIWDDAANGLLQVWIDNVIVYDKQVTTVRSGWDYGGNAKWGIYKWTWADQAGVSASAEAGVTHLTTLMGALKIITRRRGDIDYGKNSYSEVAPQ